MQRARALIAESVAVSRSQPVASALTLLIVAGMVATVLLTTGRTVGAEQAVVQSIDDVGTRSIVVRAEQGAGLSAEILHRLQNVEGIDWAGAFGAASDVSNTNVRDGNKVPARLAWGSFTEFGVADPSPLPNETAWASSTALSQLGLLAPAGGIVSASGVSFSIGGQFETPQNLAFLEPLIVIPQDWSSPETEIAVLVVVADDPALVAPITTVVQSMLGVSDLTKVSIATSETLASLRAIVQGQLGTFGRSLMVVVFSLSSVLVAVVLYGLVMMRRKDFGRRRALGASQRLIVTLLILQTALLSIVGALIGCFGAVAAILALGDPLPEFAFLASVTYLAVVVGTVAAVAPAIIAARREPIIELRVP